MSIHALANLQTPVAPTGLLASNAGRKPGRHAAKAAAPALSSKCVSPWTKGSPIRIGLPHMELVVSISAESGSSAGRGPDFAMPAASDGMPADPVIERLLHELGQTESDGGDDGVHGDAIRLALVARWLTLRSESAGNAQADHGALQKWRLKRVIAYIDEHIGEAIALADLARTAGLSRMYFAARFRTATGLRPHEYILRRRIERAKEMLARTDEALVEIAFNVGFQTQAHFTTVFKRFTGDTPGRWRFSMRQFA